MREWGVSRCAALRRLRLKTGRIPSFIFETRKMLLKKTGRRRVQSDLPYGPLREQSSHLRIDEGVVRPPAKESRRQLLGRKAVEET
jgi:hypothetical protein